MTNMIDNPKHYQQASVPLEPIDVLRHAPFDLGNCLKYILRAGHKGDALEDWKKAKKYLDWAIESHHMNYKHYSDFFDHYGLLLCKFEVFKHISFKHNQLFFKDLDDLINDNIRSISNKNL